LLDLFTTKNVKKKETEKVKSEKQVNFKLDEQHGSRKKPDPGKIEDRNTLGQACIELTIKRRLNFSYCDCFEERLT